MKNLHSPAARQSKWLPRATILLIVLTILSACGGAAGTATAPSGGAATSAPTAAATSAPGGGATATTAKATSPARAASPAAAGSPGAAGSPTYGFKPGAGSPVDNVTLSAPVTITLWHTQTGPREDKMKQIAADFEKQNPNIKVNLELQDGYTNLFKKVQAAITGGGLPDIAVSYESMVSEYQAADVVVPLEDYINSRKNGLTARDLADFYPAYITANQYPEYGGKMLSFPFTKSVLVMYYNADKLKEAGVPVPRTWDDFVAACKQFTGDTKGYAIAIDASTFDGAVYSNGGELINKDQTQWLFNGPAGQQYLADLQEMVKSGCAYQEEKQYADQTAFGQGKVVFTMSSSAGFLFYQQEVDKGAKFNWSVAIIPHGKGAQPVTTLYGANIAMFKSTPEKQLAAWLFIKYFTSTQVNADWSAFTGYLPIRKSAAASPVVQQQFDKLPAYKVAVNDIQQYGREETTIRGTQDTRTYIENAMQAAIADPSQSPKAILDDAVKKGNDALKQNR
ncbi:MAG TPA: ABC transporter substrate-binding protein [Thermomicrobiales bacterium]|nr:ABC transporter substrate-binding protein [Thermomicrobiales bacterium]